MTTQPAMTTQPVTGWTASTLLFDGDARQAAPAASTTPRCGAPYPAPPQKPVDLDPHEISVTQYPEVEVTLNGQRIVSLRFELAIVVAVSGLRAIVRVGRLAAVESGSCTVTVTLSVQGARLARRVRDLEAPLVVAFGEGIPLRVPRQAQGMSR